MLKYKFNRTNLSNSQKYLADYLELNISSVVDLNIEQLAKEASVSKASIIRFCQKLGYSGYSDFKIALAKQLGTSSEAYVDSALPFSAKDDLGSVIDKIGNLHIQAIKQSIMGIDQQQLNDVIQALYDAPLIYLKGLGPSLLVAEQFNYDATKIGLPIISLPFEGYHVPIIQPNQHNIALIISQSAKGYNISKWVKTFKQQGLKVILITSNANSPLLKLIDYPLLIENNEPRYQKIASFESRASFSLILDIIYARLFQMNYQSNLQAFNDFNPNLEKSS